MHFHTPFPISQIEFVALNTITLTLPPHIQIEGRRGHNRMVVGFTTTCAISSYHHLIVSSNSAHGEVYSIQHYAIKFVSDLRHVAGFLRVLLFPQPRKLTATI